MSKKIRIKSANKEPLYRQIKSSKQFSKRARQLLKEPLLGVLAILREDGSIIQTEMWYDIMNDDTILMNTATFRHKYRHLQQKNPSVSFFVSRGTYQYISINGSIALNKDSNIAQKDIHHLAKRYLGKEQAVKAMEGEFSKQERVSIILTPTKIIEYFSH